MNKILTLLIFAWFGLCQLADGALSDYQDLVIDDISKPEMLARLQSGADLNNVAVIELLLQKAGYLYTDLINKNFAAKQNLVIDYLKRTSESLITGVAAGPEVILPEPVKLPLVAADGALSDYQDLVIDDISKPEILEQLQSGEDLHNVAVIELLLQKAGYLYTDLINKNFAAKQNLVIDYLKNNSEPLITSVLVAPEVILPDLAVGTLPEPVALPLVAADLITWVKTKTGFGELEIKQRLLNNVLVLEYLLSLLGQDYQESIKSDLIAKQAVLDKVEASALLKTLYDHGYTQDQLVLLVNSSSSQAPEYQPLMVAGHKGLNIDAKYLPKEVDVLVRQFPLQNDIIHILNKTGKIPDFQVDYSDDYFTQQQYDYLMKLIQQISPDIYLELNNCIALTNRNNCMQKSYEMEVLIFKKAASFEKLYIPRFLLNNIHSLCKSFFQAIELMKKTDPTDIINLINEMSPDLMIEILKINPDYLSSLRYINSLAGTASVSCAKDGLPKITFDKVFIDLSKSEQKFIIAHELSHYALGHCVDMPKASGIKGLDNYQDSFKKSYSRILESEADRFAVMRLGASPDAGISWLKSRYSENKSIGSTHPSDLARIEQLEEIKREMALRPVNNLEPVDWDAAKQVCLDFHHRLPLG